MRQKLTAASSSGKLRRRNLCCNHQDLPWLISGVSWSVTHGSVSVTWKQLKSPKYGINRVYVRNELMQATWRNCRGRNSSGLKIHGWSVRRHKQALFPRLFVRFNRRCSIFCYVSFLESSEGSAFPLPVVFTGKKSQTKCTCPAASQEVKHTGHTKAPEANSARLFIFIYISWRFCACRPRLADPRAYIHTSNMDKDKWERLYYYWEGLRANHMSVNISLALTVKPMLRSSVLYFVLSNL